MQITMKGPQPLPTDVGTAAPSGESPLGVAAVSAPQKVQEQRAATPEFKEENLVQLLKKAEEMNRIFGRDIKFRYQKEAELYQVEIVDRQANKVIRKIPPDEIVRLIENINAMLGAIFDKKF